MRPKRVCKITFANSVHCKLVVETQETASTCPQHPESFRSLQHATQIFTPRTRNKDGDVMDACDPLPIPFAEYISMEERPLLSFLHFEVAVDSRA